MERHSKPDEEVRDMDMGVLMGFCFSGNTRASCSLPDAEAERGITPVQRGFRRPCEVQSVITAGCLQFSLPAPPAHLLPGGAWLNPI